MTTVFDRLRDELDQLGDRMQTALEQGKLHVERSGVLGRRSDAARELGMLAWRRHRGETIDTDRHAQLLERMDALQEELTVIDRKMSATRAEDVSVGEEPAPAAEPADATVHPPA